MPDQDALNREVAERMRTEMGNLLQQIIILQVKNEALQREVERLTALARPENKPDTTGNSLYERVSPSG